jgi:hypothetical protein
MASGAAALGALGAIGVFPGIMWSVAAVVVANALRGWVSLWPYDRILSATSVDGLTWTVDRGVRVDVAGRYGDHPGGVYYPFVARVPSGLWRMYFRGSDVERIVSATSEDGLSWTLEPGTRMDVGGTPPFARVSCPRMIVQGGVHRMFFTAMPVGAAGFSIFSAVSNDGLTWTREPGERLAVGERDPGGSIQSFCVTPAHIDGEELRLYYEEMSSVGSKIYLATSTDGLHWNRRGMVLEGEAGEFGVRFPWVVRLPAHQGWRMYFTAGTPYPYMGTAIHSATSTDGIRWRREAGTRVPCGGRYDNLENLSPCVVPMDGRLRMYYAGCCGLHLLSPRTRRRHKRHGGFRKF